MVDNASSPVTSDISLAARERITIGPAPEWVTQDSISVEFKPKTPDQVTWLFYGRQVHAELRQTYSHNAARLETMQAVQQMSQWRLAFEPRTQRVVIHHIRIRRGETFIEHADLAKFRFLQREEGLEGFIIHGWVTILLVLDDVRPGDVLESCYTIESRDDLLPDTCAHFFSLPQNISVGKYVFAVRFAETRPMKWKTSSADLKLSESRQDGEVHWVCQGENYSGPEAEPNAPSWSMDHPWIQISDWQDWAAVGSAISRTWKEVPEDSRLAEIAASLTPPEPELPEMADKEAALEARVEMALRLVQDEFRYLSVNLELGGHVPTAPGTVVLRRYGDCKDLSFLLVHLLRLLGVPARPVLVNTALHHAVGNLLPAAALFNHAVVEYELRGQTRWVDATVPRQGGGPLRRVIQDYGMGLPVSASSPGLIEALALREPIGVYDLKETILLDTSGKSSLLSIVLTTKGGYADSLRQQFIKGLESVSKERLQMCANRYGWADRDGVLQFRDDRDSNEFVLAEVFKISGFLFKDSKPGIYKLRLPDNLIVSALPPVQKTSRRTPFALPYPCNLVHTIEVLSPAVSTSNKPRCKLHSPFLQFESTHQGSPGSWKLHLSLSTLSSSVPPDKLELYKNYLAEIRLQSMWSLFVKMGVPVPRRRSDFGELPGLRRVPASTLGEVSKPDAAAGPAIPRPSQPAASDPESRGRHRHQHRHRRHRRRLPRWVRPVAIGLGFLLMCLWAAISRLNK